MWVRFPHDNHTNFVEHWKFNLYPVHASTIKLRLQKKLLMHFRNVFKFYFGLPSILHRIQLKIYWGWIYILMYKSRSSSLFFHWSIYMSFVSSRPFRLRGWGMQAVWLAMTASSGVHSSRSAPVSTMMLGLSELVHCIVGWSYKSPFTLPPHFSRRLWLCLQNFNHSDLYFCLNLYTFRQNSIRTPFPKSWNTIP